MTIIKEAIMTKNKHVQWRRNDFSITKKIYVEFVEMQIIIKTA